MVIKKFLKHIPAITTSILLIYTLSHSIDRKDIEEIKKTIVFIGDRTIDRSFLWSKIRSKDNSKYEEIVEEIISELVKKGYCNISGKILSKTYKVNRLDLSENLARYEKEIIETLQEANNNFHATGFLVEVQNFFHLLTAKHVVADMITEELQDDGMLIFFNSKDGKISSRLIWDIKERFNVNWVFHQNKKIDIAIIPFGLDPSRDDVKVIPNHLFLSTEKIFELYDIFFLSYQPGIEPKGKISPIIRSGVISKINEDKTFYVDAFAFPGNSGSPVFLKPSAIRFDKEGITIGKDELGGKFMGIVGEYLTYREPAISIQTGRPRVIFEENTGLSRVWSVDFIEEIIKSDKFREQLNKLQMK